MASEQQVLEPGNVAVQYKGEQDMKLVKQLVDPELSEPYSIFTYRLFLTPWPQLCHFCYVDDKPVGVVVCKVDDHKSGRRRGYIGMIVVIKEYRKYGIGSTSILLSSVGTQLILATSYLRSQMCIGKDQLTLLQHLVIPLTAC